MSIPGGSTYIGAHMLACQVVLKLLIYCRLTLSYKWLTNLWSDNAKQHPRPRLLGKPINQPNSREEICGWCLDAKSKRSFYIGVTVIKGKEWAGRRWWFLTAMSLAVIADLPLVTHLICMISVDFLKKSFSWLLFSVLQKEKLQLKEVSVFPRVHTR